MRIDEIEIRNFRGIRDLRLTPGGKNMVIWGPNGTGKSGVVDAIDFLLTGKISRLTGEGTGKITLKQYGSHIDAPADEAVVTARIRIPGSSTLFELSRSVSDPNHLSCHPTATEKLTAALSLAIRGQHVLSRREILKFVTAEGSTRAQQIQQLLNVSQAETIRSTLTRFQGDQDRQLKGCHSGLKTAEAAAAATAQLRQFDAASVLDTINQARSELGGSQISSLSPVSIKSQMSASTAREHGPSTNPTLVSRYVGSINQLLTTVSTIIDVHDSALRSHVSAILVDPQTSQAEQMKQLVDRGILLLDGSGKCPLCEMPWEPDALRSTLESRAGELERSLGLLAEARSHAKEISAFAVGLSAGLESLRKASAELGDATTTKMLIETAVQLTECISALDDSPITYVARYADAEQFEQLIRCEELTERLPGLVERARSQAGSLSKEQTAWDTLTRFEENLRAIETAKAKANSALENKRRADKLLECFLEARDDVLNSLYASVRDRFVELYRRIHHVDEDDFVAQIEHHDAAVDISVDFYGRGSHPPHALHSEGHQDSMGVCLFLAMAEYLTRGVLDITVLDDVVMSVDVEHRRDFGSILADSFGDRQMFITTHDWTWANQLKAAGVAKGGALIQFYGWDVDSGPRVNSNSDIWEKISDALEKRNIPSAAHQLRRGSEQYFAEVCESLRGTVVYKQSGNMDLGELLGPSMAKYGQLLKRAKNAANSWNQLDEMHKYQELESIKSQVFRRIQAEQWSINPAVHYNNWADFSPQDFVPVVEAFRDLFELFRCPSCEAVLRVEMKGNEEARVTCRCGNITWNLIPK